MEMEEDQQQQQHHSHTTTHSSILDGIARLADPQIYFPRHRLTVDGLNKPRVDARSLQYLVGFLDNRNRDSREVVITELQFRNVELFLPSDGGLDVLRALFSRSDSTLTKVTIFDCNFGSREEALQLLAAFERNRTVTDLAICRGVHNLEGAPLGSCLAGLSQNMQQLRRLNCFQSTLGVEGVRAFQPGLRSNRHLKELGLSSCQIGDEGIRLIADAFVGNTTMEILSIRGNGITSVGLDDITRILEESKRIQNIDLGNNPVIFNDESCTQRFFHVLSRYAFLKELNLGGCHLGDNGIRVIADALDGNTIMDGIDISENGITSVGLADITRLLVSTLLKNIAFHGNERIFNDEDATQHFVSTLQHKQSSVQELPWLSGNFPVRSSTVAATLVRIYNSLTRNRQLNRVTVLLVPTPQQQQQRNEKATLMMFKTWHMAITKFAIVPNNAGASAIFKLLQARPQLLEKRLKRTAAVAALGDATERSSSSSSSLEPQRTRPRHHYLSLKSPCKEEPSTTASTTAATTTSMTMNHDTAAATTTTTMDSFSRAQLVELIHQKDGQISQLVGTISQQDIKISEQADMITTLQAAKSSNANAAEGGDMELQKEEEDQKIPAVSTTTTSI